MHIFFIYNVGTINQSYTTSTVFDLMYLILLWDILANFRFICPILQVDFDLQWQLGPEYLPLSDAVTKHDHIAQQWQSHSSLPESHSH